MSRLYFDNNATTPLLPAVYAAMRECYEAGFGNASAITQEGQHARAKVEAARSQLAALFGARASEIVFNSGGTEGDNMALFGLLAPGDHFITSKIEHHAILHAAEELARRGVEVTYLDVDREGLLAPEALRAAMRAETRLVSIMLANNETGVIEPIQELAAIAHESGAKFHTDAVQAVGKIAIDVEALGVDLLSLSGHKLHGPQGVGALYVRRGTPLQPLLFGGRHERGRRPGTENLAGVVGLGAAAELAREWLTNGGAEQMASLRNRLEQGIVAAIDAVRINAASAPRTPNTTNIVFECTEGEALVIALDLLGATVATGSACSSGSIDPSHVLLAMGLPTQDARASLRISLGKQNTAEEVDALLALLPAAVERLRSLSPVWRKRGQQ